MLIQRLIYITLSVFVVIFSNDLYQFFIKINLILTQLEDDLLPLFQRIGISYPLQQTILLAAIPFVISCIPAAIYYLLQHKKIPYFQEMTWFFWLMLVLNRLLINTHHFLHH